MSPSILLDFQSFAEVDSAGNIQGHRFPLRENDAFAEKPPLGRTVARVNLLDPIPALITRGPPHSWDHGHRVYYRHHRHHYYH
jgi:hypothetical protein